MMQHIIPIISQFFSTGFAAYFFFPLIGLAFIATVPCIIRQIILRK